MRRALPTAGFALLIGCANTGPLEAELSRLRGELHQVRKTLSETEKRVEELEQKQSRSPAALSAAPAPSGPARSAPSKSPSKLRKSLPVVKLNQQQGGKVISDQGELDDGRPPLLIRIVGQKTDALTVDHSVLKKPDPLQDSAGSPVGPPLPAPTELAKQEYEAALAALRDKQKPAEAVKAFKRFVRTHSKHRLVSNAYYWLGEGYFAQENYPAALKTFSKLSRKYPRSAKVPYALLRSAEAQLFLGKEAKGQSTLQELLRRFPKSEAAQQARARMRSSAGAQ